MQEAKEDACKYMQNSWEALGNYQGGTVITESIEGLKSLRAAERLDKEACFIENANIDYYNNRK